LRTTSYCWGILHSQPCRGHSSVMKSQEFCHQSHLTLVSWIEMLCQHFKLPQGIQLWRSEEFFVMVNSLNWCHGYNCHFLASMLGFPTNQKLESLYFLHIVTNNLILWVVAVNLLRCICVVFANFLRFKTQTSDLLTLHCFFL